MSDTARLKWKCRRGMKELDLLLERYLDTRYPGADAAEQGAFRELLDMQDPELFAFVVGRERPNTEELRRVIDALRRAP
ncbi:MAG TPA: succinate dehydrogenase assembly factor 2 [Gammaproteobacteria bacterium]|nr:succinate dehydrogenase assembly factor 2 [Gammaproteobacteria bacterium]